MPAIFQRFREEYLALPPEADKLYHELRGNTPQKIVHGKYPWLIHLIRYVVGDSSFQNALQLVFERFRFRTFSMPEFIATLEEGCGQSLQWWREEWLERKGVPVIALTSEIQSTDDNYRIVGTIAQLRTLYHLPLEVGIETEKGLRIERVMLSGKETTFAFESKEKPTRILLDPGNWLLMKNTP